MKYTDFHRTHYALHGTGIGYNEKLSHVQNKSLVMEKQSNNGI